MKTRISALMDGELDGNEASESLDAMRRGEALRRQWSDAHLIGEALRNEKRLDFDISASVMAALEQEPTVLAPQRRAQRDWSRPALALAASVAGVAVVAWLGLGPAAERAPAAQLALAPAKALPVAATVPSTPRLQEYLVAHQAYSPAGPMVGGARNIRTVAVAGEGR
ncbi:MAG: sigma-E factor negative regulatory protein [Rhodocyclales bacterium]|nr:sigma-E factor negative regulatory protein [Rhodocyclales bacterium]